MNHSDQVSTSGKEASSSSRSIVVDASSGKEENAGSRTEAACLSETNTKRRPNKRKVKVSMDLASCIHLDNLEALSMILSRPIDDDNSSDAPTEEDIDDAFYTAVTHGSLDAIEMLFNNLSEDGMEKYLNGESHACVLYIAIAEHRPVVFEFLFQQCRLEISQQTRFDALCAAIACGSVRLCGFLLANGADPNRCTSWAYHPLRTALEHEGNTRRAIIRLLLENGADPSMQFRDGMMDYHNSNEDDVMADRALSDGDPELLSLLLHHGASLLPVPFPPRQGPEYCGLYNLLRRPTHDHETKLNICRVLVEHAKVDEATKTFIQASLEGVTMLQNMKEFFRVLLESGVVPSGWTMMHDIVQRHGSMSRVLVESDRVDPFQATVFDDPYDDTLEGSLFRFSASADDTSFFEFLLDLWNERFSASNGGKDESGSLPMQVVCRVRNVTLSAIQLMIERHGHTLMTAAADHYEDEDGLYPFQSAAKNNASLDVVYSLLRHCPDALNRGL